MRISDWSSDVCSSDLQLVDNAIDASPADRSVQLVAAGEGGRVRIEVIDEGSGMTRDFIRHDLFKPFASTKAAGFGLGAFEALQLAQAMGGTIDVTSRSEERRVGKECVSTCRSRWSPSN